MSKVKCMYCEEEVFFSEGIFTCKKCSTKLAINLNEYNYKCGNGCCDNFGIITTINGKELQCHNQDVKTIVGQILEYLGFEVEITESCNGELIL